MSNTPRTDAAKKLPIGTPPTTWVSTGFARQLERELAEALACKSAAHDRLSDAYELLDEAKKIIENVGTTGVNYQHKNAESWLKKYTGNPHE